jgi:hypothetical protein
VCDALAAPTRRGAGRCVTSAGGREGHPRPCGSDSSSKRPHYTATIDRITPRRRAARQHTSPAAHKEGQEASSADPPNSQCPPHLHIHTAHHVRTTDTHVAAAAAGGGGQRVDARTRARHRAADDASSLAALSSTMRFMPSW